jgi:hypothetical protein
LTYDHTADDRFSTTPRDVINVGAVGTVRFVV